MVTATAEARATDEPARTPGPKIAIIGAGGVIFPLRLMGDMLTFPSLRGATYALMDLDRTRAERTAVAARDLAKHYGFPATIEATDDRREALTGAAYVIVTFMVGGLDVYRHDMEIPRTYGVDQRVGDTLGPGGVFRFLRSAPAYAEVARDILEVCPDALLINYANPMAMNCWYLTALGITAVGLCHSVQGTSRMLAEQIGESIEDIAFQTAGINHQAWFLKFQKGDEDLYPQLRETMIAKNLGDEFRGVRFQRRRSAPRSCRCSATSTPNPARMRVSIFPISERTMRSSTSMCQRAGSTRRSRSGRS